VFVPDRGGVRSITTSVSARSHVSKLHVQTSLIFLYIYLCRACIGPTHSLTLCTSDVVDDVMFSRNGPNTDTCLESATYRIIRRDLPDGAAKLRTWGRSLLSPITLLVSVYRYAY